VSNAPPILVIELAVEPRRSKPLGPYCLCDTSGKGYPAEGDLATGEEKVSSNRGLTGEAISCVWRTEALAALVKVAASYRSLKVQRYRQIVACCP
jgi:hypothetical protein